MQVWTKHHTTEWEEAFDHKVFVTAKEHSMVNMYSPNKDLTHVNTKI